MNLFTALATFTIGVFCTVVFLVIPLVEREARRAQERGLQDALLVMRGAIKQYSAERGELPKSLDDLVKAGLIAQIPIDPVTQRREWRLTIEDRWDGIKTERGIVNVHSTSKEVSSQNTYYSDW